MRKSISTFLLLAFFMTAYGQQTTVTTPELTKADYLKKSKSQKTGAWILAGGGFVLTTVGTAILLDDAAEEFVGIFDPEVSDGGGDAGAVLMVAGLAAIGGSIPLFIASGKNKRKAMSLSFKNYRVPQLQNSNFFYSSVPSISFKISL